MEYNILSRLNHSGSLVNLPLELGMSELLHST